MHRETPKDLLSNTDLIGFVRARPSERDGASRDEREGNRACRPLTGDRRNLDRSRQVDRPG